MKLFGYKNLFKNLVNLDKSNKFPSRILLTGQEGIGKTTFAFHLINYLLSKNEKDKYSLEENIINSNSKSYHLIKNFSHPNFYFICKNDGKKVIEIDQIRNMINFLNKSSFDNNKKIILIDGAEHLNDNSSNALLKSLEESNNQNIFILTHNLNKKILDTISSRCLSFRLNLDYSEIDKILSQYFEIDIYNDLNHDFKFLISSPKFLINHINFINENKLTLKSSDVTNVIRYIIDNKLYKKNSFIADNYQSYIEIYFLKMYSKTNDFRYYDFLLETITDNNLFNKFNLDLDSFFLKFENKYLNI